MYDEEEVPNVKRMHVVEEDDSLSQPKTIVVPPEEEEVSVPQGPAIMVPPEEEEVPAPLSRSCRKEVDALSRSMTMALYRPW
jgi:hypothetical protein